MKTEEKLLLFLSPVSQQFWDFGGPSLMITHTWKIQGCVSSLASGEAVLRCGACCCCSVHGLLDSAAACAEASMLVRTGSQAGNHLPHFSKLCGAVFQMVLEVLGWCCCFSATSLFSWKCPVFLTQSLLCFLELTVLVQDVPRQPLK